LLYKNDAKSYGSSAVFHAIMHCDDQSVALQTLKAAQIGGANLQHCQAVSNGSQGAYCTHLIVYPSLYLAATRGLDQIVSFLLDYGLPPDGPEGVDIPPLFGALSAGQETTALLLVQCGASIVSKKLGMNALHASVQAGLPRVTSHLVQDKNMDVNERSNSGATPVMLAIYSGRPTMVPQLVILGANVYEPLLSACSRYDFIFALKLLDAASSVLTHSLHLQECLDVLMLIIRDKSTYGKHTPRIVLDKLLGLVTVHCSEQQGPFRGLLSSGANDKGRRLSTESASLLDGFLQRMLSIDHGDRDVASTLLTRGAMPQAGTFIELLSALNSPLFERNKPRLLRQHPRLLQMFQLVYAHCVSTPPGDRDIMMTYFLRRTPEDALCLVSRMSVRGIPLTAHGVQRLAQEVSSE
jgi:ankyrin repeat protein